uniref:Uncharacterized protein n=1 Tax=Candidatus Kentrum sp. LFY TaxID=2126342 RepID=A0A450U7X3_9GAMM|nr:MAG: hypothetical protein BECKLFY1418A_GA0070994_100317 [Candidatus Kentron sp. LFY]
MVLFISGCAGLPTAEETRLTVGKLLDEIQIAVNEIKNETGISALPPFQKAEVTLSAEATKNMKGEASFYLKTERDYENRNADTISFVLVPSSNRISGISSTSGHEIAKYVIATVQAISKKEHLQLKKSTISAGLKVKITKGGGVSVELVGISIEGSKTFSSTTGHQLKLVFAHPEEKKIEP